MQISTLFSNFSEDLKFTLFVNSKAGENFSIDKRGRYSLTYRTKLYKIRDYVLDYSDYLSNYFENNPNTNELKLEFKYATSVQALDVVMRLLFGFEDVLIPNQEYIEVIAFIEELSKPK